jgi:hypothetical protein
VLLCVLLLCVQAPKQPKPRPALRKLRLLLRRESLRKQWSATISYDSKQHNLGIFDTKQGAALAYDKAQ